VRNSVIKDLFHELMGNNENKEYQDNQVLNGQYGGKAPSVEGLTNRRK
jgi:hypothetical protein